MVTVCFVSVTGLPFAIVVRSSHSPERGFLRQAALAAVAGAPDALACKDRGEVADPRLLLANRGSGKLVRPRPDRLLARRAAADAWRPPLPRNDRSTRRPSACTRAPPSPRAARVDASRGTRPGSACLPPAARCRPEGRRAAPWPRPDASLPSRTPPRRSSPGQVPRLRGSLRAGREPGTSPKAECR